MSGARDQPYLGIIRQQGPSLACIGAGNQLNKSMPLLIAIAGIAVTVLLLWLRQGGGIELIGWKLHRKVRSIEIARAREAEERAPLRAIRDPRGAALALFFVLLQLRDDVGERQCAAVSRLARTRLQVPEPVAPWLTAAQFAASRALSPENAIADVVPSMRSATGPEEKADFISMLEELAHLDGTPTSRQLDMIVACREALSV